MRERWSQELLSWEQRRQGESFFSKEPDLRLELVDGLLQLDGVGLIDLGYDYTFDDNLNVSYN